VVDDQYHLNDKGLRDLRRLVKKFSIPEVMEAMRVARDAYLETDDEGKYTLESVQKAWSKVGGICHNKRVEKEDPARSQSDKGYYSFRARYRDKTHYPPDWALKKWWDEEVLPVYRSNQGRASLAELPREVFQACVDSYYNPGGFGSYFGALEWVGEQGIADLLDYLERDDG